MQQQEQQWEEGGHNRTNSISHTSSQRASLTESVDLDAQLDLLKMRLHRIEEPEEDDYDDNMQTGQQVEDAFLAG